MIAHRRGPRQFARVTYLSPGSRARLSPRGSPTPPPRLVLLRAPQPHARLIWATKGTGTSRPSRKCPDFGCRRSRGRDGAPGTWRIRGVGRITTHIGALFDQPSGG